MISPSIIHFRETMLHVLRDTKNSMRFFFFFFVIINIRCYITPLYHYIFKDLAAQSIYIIKYHGNISYIHTKKKCGLVQSNCISSWWSKQELFLWTKNWGSYLGEHNLKTPFSMYLGMDIFILTWIFGPPLRRPNLPTPTTYIFLLPPIKKLWMTRLPVLWTIIYRTLFVYGVFINPALLEIVFLKLLWLLQVIVGKVFNENIGFHSAVREVFPNWIITTCFFYFKQAIFRYSKKTRSPL